MTGEKSLVAKEGLDELLREQDSLVHVARDEVVRELQEARAQGDLSENADYNVTRDRQARVEARIRGLEAMIANAEVIPEDKKTATKKIVPLGSTVTTLDMSTNEKKAYNIVGSIEADPLNGKLSNITPLTASLMDHKIGDVAEIETAEESYQIKVTDLKQRKRTEKVLFFFQEFSC